MKYLAWIISAINIYIGLRCLLNVIGVLQTSKYSQTATAVFAVLFLTMGISGFYFSLATKNNVYALLAGIGPWVLALVFLLINMLTSDYK